MTDELRKQIYENLDLKETEELVEIWRTNDRVEWTEQAFDVVREILKDRLGKLPKQNEPVFKHITPDPDDQIDENAPILYKPREVLWLEMWLNRAAIIAVIASIFPSLLELNRMQGIVWGYFANYNGEFNPLSWVITIIVFVSSVVLQSIIIYFPLKALGSILKILMQMEFKSRGVKQKNA